MKKIVLLLGVIIMAFAACKSTKDTADATAQNAEVNTRTATQRGTGERGPRSRGNMDEMFARMDTNGDNKLTKDEMKGRMAERFDSIDLDKDGYITKEEMAKAPRPEGGRRKQQ